MSEALDFNVLKGSYGPIEAMRVVEMMEEMVRTQETMDLLRLSPDERLERAMEKINDLDFSRSLATG
jgi:hypothetical protein